MNRFKPNLLRRATQILGLAFASACMAAPAPAEYGKVVMTVEEPPQHFAAPWPASTDALAHWWDAQDALPQGHAIEGLLSGDPELFARLSQASRKVPASERADWVRNHARLMEFKPVRPGFCTLARPAFAGPASALRDVLAVPFVHACLKAEDRALVLRADTPAIAVIEYFAGWNSGVTQRPAWDPRFADAVNAEYEAARDRFSKSRVAWKLTAHPDPRSEQALIALYRRVSPGDEKIELGLILRRAKGAEARRIGQTVCIEFANSAPCRQDQASGAQVAEMRAKGFEVITGDDEFPPAPAEAPPDKPEKIRALADRLIAAGFVQLEGLDLAGVKRADALDILAEAGLVTGFDVETGMFPNQHDSLMRDLAWLTGDALAGALFEEIPPVYDEKSDDAAEVGPYRLSVYLGGKRYRIDAENRGDWYDLESVLKLMNAVLADRNSALRLFVLDGGGQTAVVVAASPATFAEAERQGLLHSGEADAAEAAGKGYERQVLDKLQ